MANPLDDARVAKGMAAQFALREQRLAAGEKSLGWKAGFGAPAALEKMRLDAALVGFIHDRNKLPSGATAAISDWSKPAAEPEIAIYLGRDVAGGADADAARAAITAIGPAIELADIDAPLDDVEAILSGDIFHRHVILGEVDTSRAGGDVSGLNARVMRNGAEFAETSEVEALTGPLIAIVQRVADTVAAMGETLRRGEVIIAGSITPPIFLDADDRLLSYALDPIGSVSVSFSG